MRSCSRLFWLLTAVLLFVLSGCGGDGGNSNGTLTLIVDPEMSLKGNVTAKATYSNPKAATVQNVPISFSTNKPTFIGAGVTYTDPSGTATRNITFTRPTNPLDAPTTDTPVTLTASYGDIVATATFIVKPAKMTVTPPATQTFTAEGAVGSTFRVIPTGMFVKVVDGDNTPLNNIPVTISVDSIVNGEPGDVLFWSDYPGGTLSAPPTVFSKNTDVAGQVPMQVTIDVLVPSVSHAISVTWRVTFTDPDSGALLTQYAVTGITVTS